MSFEKQQKFKQRTLEIESDIQEAIGKICEKYDHNVTYLEINTALVKILHSNNQYELRETLKEDEPRETKR